MKRQMIALLIVLVVVATSISIEAFQLAAVPSLCSTGTNSVPIRSVFGNQYSISSPALNHNNNNNNIIIRKITMKQSLWRLHQAADAWTGNAGGGGGGDTTSASRLVSGGGYGSIEQIEYKIYSDGRVEELVRGIKGNNCHKVTQSIHEQLGEVVATQPTEELYEQEVQVSQTLYNTDSTSSSSGGGDWSSSSSW
jgi:hypothetical protein